MTRGDNSAYPKFNPLFIAEFVDSLNAKKSPRYTECIKYFKIIENALLTTNSISVDRVYLSGSLGKNTALHYIYDVDIVVFVNCSGYTDFIQKQQYFVATIESVVTGAFHNASFSKIKRCNTSYQVTINGIDFDILPALCRFSKNGGYDPSSIARLQHDAIVDLVHSIGTEKCFLVSFKVRTGMAELSDSFIKEQSAFVHNVIVLAKHWCRTYLDQSASFYGRSSLIELVAVHAAIQVETSRSGENYAMALLKFLELCADFSRIAIEFDYPPNKCKFRSSHLRRNIPYIMDPVNPYHNRMHKINPRSVQALSRIAENSLNILKGALNQPESKATQLLNEFFKFQLHMNTSYDKYELFGSATIYKPESISSRQSSLRKVDSRIASPRDSIRSRTDSPGDSMRPSITSPRDSMRSRTDYGKSYPAPPIPSNRAQPQPSTSAYTRPQKQDIYSPQGERSPAISRQKKKSNCFVSFLKCLCCCFFCDDE